MRIEYSLNLNHYGVHLVEKSLLKKDMKNMMLKLKILRMISRNKTYSYAIVKDFTENSRASKFFGGKQAIKNQVYNTINALEKSGYIRLSKQLKSKTAKNYYIITHDGKSALDGTRKVFASSMKEISYILK
jgi:DNA-binding PadR family transcriptional regulator